MIEKQAKLRIIYGRSGSGKSEYIYHDMDKKIEQFKNIYIIVPEQSNLTSEKKFFEITGRKSLFNVQVLTLSRMAYRISNELGGDTNHLSKIGKSMMIYDLLKRYKKELHFLGKSERNIEMVDRMFTEFKKHNVSVETLKNVKLEDKYTALKLKDIQFLYEKYEERLAQGLMDENDELTKLGKQIKDSTIFENSCIYFDEFFGFTPQEYVIFEELLKKCNEISIAIALNKMESEQPKEKDIFYFNRQYAKKILEIGERQKCKIELVHLNEGYRFKNKELAVLEKSLYGNNQQYEKQTEHVLLFLASNPYAEVEYVAKKIYELVKNHGLKYREIGIIASDIENYAEDAKAIFAKYQIPIFVDEKKALNQNILMKYILALLDIFEQNWSYEAMFSYLKIGLLDLDDYDIYVLENYCKKWGIRGNKWDKEFCYETLNEKQEKLEHLRKQIVEPLMDFKKSFMENKTVLELTQNIYQFLLKQHIIENLDQKIKECNDVEISNEYHTSYKILVHILEEMVNLFGKEKVTFEKYKELLVAGIQASELGKIPATQDQVILGDVDRTRSNKIKALFILGMNDGIFPKTNRQEGYLNDQDRILLAENGIELAKTSMDSLYENQFNLYRTFTIPEEKLFLSYCSSDKDGKSVRPSIVIKKIKYIFPNLTKISDVVTKYYAITNEKATFEETLQMYQQYLEGNEIDEKWKELLIYFYDRNKNKFSKAVSGMNYTNKAEKISLQNIRKMYGTNLKTTISRLETYRKCPFSFHMTYGLKLKENEHFQITTMDTGSFMHEVIDSFFAQVEEKELDLKDISEEEMKQIVEKIMDEILQTSRYYIFSSSAKFRMMTKRLKKVVLQSMNYIVYSLKYSDFKPIGHEVVFDEKSEYKPIKLQLDSGEKIEIVGKIDRVDVGKLKDKEYVRIIDYKSQIKKLDFNQVVSGLQIQLITYLDALTEQDGFEPAGVLYLGLVDSIVKAQKNLSKEKIEEEIRKSCKMQGLLLADVNVVKMMDNKLEQGYSDVIPVYVGKDGELSKKSNVATKQEFENLQKTVKKTISQISNEILKGNIAIKPYFYQKKTGCDYCKYQSICMFNPNMKGNEYDYIKNKSNAEVLNEIMEQTNLER